MSITLTPKAIEAVKKMFAENNYPATANLRVVVDNGGCHGFEYRLHMDEHIDEENDQVFDYNGFKVVVDNKSELYLSGTTIDYIIDEALNRSGFAINNPNAARSCGCGSSFSV